MHDANQDPDPDGAVPAGPPTDPAPEPFRNTGAQRLEDGYAVDRELGRGGTSIVEHAVRRSDGREVAIKTLLHEHRGDDVLALRHVLEGRYLERIRHPHVVTVLGSFLAPDTPAIIMEYLAGGSLRRLLAAGPVPPATAYRLLGQVAAGLAAIHEQGLVHRDVKPDNIMVTDADGSPHAVITDFGIAFHRDGPRLTRVNGTTTGVIGTREYIAPELWSGETPTGAADCYALGVMAYEILTGNRPFDGTDRRPFDGTDGGGDARMAHLPRTPPRPPGLPEGTWQVVNACLAKRPADRPDASLLATWFSKLSIDPAARPCPLPASPTSGNGRPRAGLDLPDTASAYATREARAPEHGADVLAEHVRRQWTEAASARGLIGVRPLPVRWHWSPRPVTGPVAEVLDDPETRVWFAPLPGTVPPTTATIRRGGLKDLFNVYGGLGSGRVIVLGAAGSGKSGAAILTLLDALEHRRNLDDARRPAVPVPVLLTAYGWDPRVQPLDDWFISRLATLYPFLRSARFGRDAVAHLVRDGRVALFLDGFDEMAPELRQAALRVIDRRQRTFRLLVLTRVDEFVGAVASGHLRGAAALELAPVRADDAAGYLERHVVSPLPPQWSQLIESLRAEPDGVLAQALDSPLNLTLLRDAFPVPADLDQLLDGRFTARENVEDLLLDRVVPEAYRREPGTRPGPYDLDQAMRALGSLAAEMNAHGTRDLAWWRVHRWRSPIPRVLFTGLFGVVAMTVVGVLVFGPLGRYTVDGATGIRFGIVYGPSMGLAFGLLAGLASEADGAPGSRPSRFSPVIGLLIGLAVTMAVGNQSHYAFGVPAGIAVGCLAGRAAVRIRLASRSRWAFPFDLPVGLAAGLPIGLAYGFTKGLPNGVAAGLVGGLVFGLMVGVARPVTNAAVPTDPGTTWIQDRRRGLVFGLSCAFPLGLALGTVNGMAHGLIAGIISGTGLGLTIGTGAMVGISSSWRASLAFLQLRHGGSPILGMRFLKDAHERGVLRTVGPLYQFRHARLQDRLAKSRSAGDRFSSRV